ncbi:hypothetical protein AYO42_01195 [Rhizomicrobium sp. SCGC AG-212-E05]|nr:hypothetical protein AYO42_01195 [Rhizomicrobium sp. SCGC AG-212-E05]
MSNTGQRDDVHQHSGWWLPLAFLFAIALLSALFLGWYLRPGPRPSAAPTGQSNIVNLTVRGSAFSIPANYIENAATRAGGDQDSLALTALFPSFRGYSESEAKLFQGNAPDSPVIHMSLRGDANNLAPEARLLRIYGPYLVNRDGVAGPFGLTQYAFRKNSGYEQNDLFAGMGTGGLVLLLCERAASDLPSPNCLAIDRPLAKNLSFSYRFKRAYLARWRELAGGVNILIRKFESR